MKSEDAVRDQFRRLNPFLDERSRREWAASEVLALGHGGLILMHRATGIAHNTITRGIEEIRERERTGIEPSAAKPLRKPGGGRPKKTDEDLEVLGALESLVECGTRGDPESPLRWTLESLRVLAAELARLGHSISHFTVAKLLEQLGYSLQGNRKTIEGAQHPDRDAQFRYIDERSCTHLLAGQMPVLSIDTKKKELVGRYKNGGREYRKQGEPERVKVHDFVGELGRASPYGVYDIGDDSAWVSVGISADTSEFAVESLRRWWQELGAERYSDCEELFITADGRGSNSHRTRLWKLELQALSDELGKSITVCHFPPGTSKWNKIEHRLFSVVTMNWRGKPLVDYATIVELIGATKTEAGLEVYCALDDNTYAKGRKVTNNERDSINLHRHDFHGDWNYTIRPRTCGAIAPASSFTDQSLRR